MDACVRARCVAIASGDNPLWPFVPLGLSTETQTRPWVYIRDALVQLLLLVLNHLFSPPFPLVTLTVLSSLILRALAFCPQDTGDQVHHGKTGVTMRTGVASSSPGTEVSLNANQVRQPQYKVRDAVSNASFDQFVSSRRVSCRRHRRRPKT